MSEPDAPYEWLAPIYYPSGFADEARHLILHLAELGLDQAVRPQFASADELRLQLPGRHREVLDRLIARPAAPDAVRILLMEPGDLDRVAGPAYHVARVMFETDGLPQGWAERCDRMDEIWVPSRFNEETFSRSGVGCRIVRIPEGIDTSRFRPDLEPLPLEGVRGTVFLAVFTWLLRKGWDVLLKAWSWAFGPDDDVTLVLRTGFPGDPQGERSARIVNAAIDDYLERELGTTRDRLAPIAVMSGLIPEADYPRLFASATALVAPSRGEGWGRPQMAAMSCGLPVLATRWSGNLDFMTDDNSMLIDVEDLVEIDSGRSELPQFWGQRWAEPSAAHLASLLHLVAADAQGARQVGARARSDMVQGWDWKQVAALAGERLAGLRAARR